MRERLLKHWKLGRLLLTWLLIVSYSMEGIEVKSVAETQKEYPLDQVDAMTHTVDGVLMPKAFRAEYVHAAMK